MKRRLALPAVAILCFISLLRAENRPLPARQAEQDVKVLFSPKGGCTEAIVEQINSAKTSVDVQAYSFTSVAIAKAITDAHSRGVKVRAILDKSQRTERYTSATFLLNHDVPVFIDDKHAIAHNKIMIIDGETILTGSFNFTKAAEESNAENLLIIRNHADLVSAYQKNFQEHLSHSSAYSGLDKTSASAR